MYGQQHAVGGFVDGALAGSPAALADAQARWEKERVAQVAESWRAHLTQIALALLAGPSGDRYSPASALKAADELMRGAKGYSP